jgi:hypothetical protein
MAMPSGVHAIGMSLAVMVPPSRGRRELTTARVLAFAPMTKT